MPVFKRGKYYYTRFQTNGIKVYESTKCTNRADAQEYEKNLKSSLKPRKNQGTLFSDACIKWINTDAPKSMYSHIGIVGDYFEGTLIINSINRAAEMKADMLSSGLNPQTVNRRLAVVRRVLNKAYKEFNMLSEPLGDKVSPLMMSEKEYAREVFLSVDECTAIFSHIKDQNVKKFLIALCATGLRLSELLNLEACQYVNGTIRLTSKTKGKKPRSIPVVDWAQDSFTVLPMQTTYSQVRGAFEHARKVANMPHVRIHDLRHTFASWLVSNPEIPMAVVRDLLGHSSIATTNKYSHLREESLKNAISKLPKLV